MPHYSRTTNKLQKLGREVYHHLMKLLLKKIDLKYKKAGDSYHEIIKTVKPSAIYGGVEADNYPYLPPLQDSDEDGWFSNSSQGLGGATLNAYPPVLYKYYDSGALDVYGTPWSYD